MAMGRPLTPAVDVAEVCATPGCAAKPEGAALENDGPFTDRSPWRARRSASCAPILEAWMSGTGFRAWLARRLDAGAWAALEAEARLARDRLGDVIEAIPEGVVFLDADGRYILWNRRYAEIYHRSADLFAPGRRLMDTLAEGVRRGDYPAAVGREAAWLAEREAMLAAGTGERHEQRLADGRWLMIEDRRTSEGGAIGLRVDITSLKEQAQALEMALARAEAANRAKDDFLADMSHALRTPLNGVAGLLRALEGAGLTTAQRGLLEEARASAAELERLVLGLIEHAEPAGSGAEAAAPLAEGLKVLVADDNATNRKVIQLMLGAVGADATCVEDGAQAVEAWRTGAFDVILMDLRMPVMDGLAAIRAIRAAEQAGGRAPTPVIVLSANTSAQDHAHSTAAGADGHIGKPVDAEQLVAALVAAVGVYAAQTS
jgi:CheY-like chemotaxis protein/PAS domain-containing protein